MTTLFFSYYKRFILMEGKYPISKETEDIDQIEKNAEKIK